MLAQQLIQFSTEHLIFRIGTFYQGHLIKCFDYSIF